MPHHPSIGFIQCLLGPLSSLDPVCPWGPGGFRRLWNAVLEALSIPSSLGLTPGGLRGGGAVSEFLSNGGDIQKIIWRMRLQHARTLEHYLQEVTARSILPRLSAQFRRKVLLGSQAFAAVCNVVSIVPSELS
jgi:hypothetical protein